MNVVLMYGSVNVVSVNVVPVDGSVNIVLVDGSRNVVSVNE